MGPRDILKVCQRHQKRTFIAFGGIEMNPELNCAHSGVIYAGQSGFSCLLTSDGSASNFFPRWDPEDELALCRHLTLQDPSSDLPRGDGFS
ncbi:hypothetical protein PAPYR_8758 [Paratrimastix pyriformis]|uniref:Uncharacterized protein n=1 Tax=Paratrimastix pyriformis TaxID=342808 RepID=A0ABQ8UE26_9EUKA|nr:hypothetical protein PAPYR_8758 [Paratrimastix pyriformis]